MKDYKIWMQKPRKSKLFFYIKNEKFLILCANYEKKLITYRKL